jgi:hypothetical protein
MLKYKKAGRQTPKTKPPEAMKPFEGQSQDNSNRPFTMLSRYFLK